MITRLIVWVGLALVAGLGGGYWLGYGIGINTATSYFTASK